MQLYLRARSGLINACGTLTLPSANIMTGLVPFPASTDTLTSFITLVGYLVKSHKTVNNYLSALHWLHHICHLDMSAFKDINIKLTQRGLERTKRHLPNRKSPITPEMLLSFRSLLNLRDSAHLALWTTLLVGFFTFFRKANLCPVSLNMFSTLHTLSHCDFLFTSWGAVITVTLTKMQQSGDTALVVLIPSIPNSPLCPVHALHELFTTVSAPDSAPAFSYISPNGELSCITAQVLRDSIRHLVTKIDLDAKSYSGHSLRRGGATFTFRCGIPAELIKIQGDWKSDAYLLYLTLLLTDRLILTQTLAKHVQHI